MPDDLAPSTGTGPPASRWRRMLVAEVWIVFAISLGASGVGALARPDQRPHHEARRALVADTTLNGSVTPDRPWLDLAFQLFGIATGLVPVALVIYLLHRSKESLRTIGVDRSQARSRPRARRAAGGVCRGCGSRALHRRTRGRRERRCGSDDAGPHWWRIPVLLLSAAQNGIYEEVIVSGYLLHRLRQFGWGDNKALGDERVDSRFVSPVPGLRWRRSATR